MMTRRTIFSIVTVLTLAAGVSTLAGAASRPSVKGQQERSTCATPPTLSGDQLLVEVQRRAFRFFWEQTDPLTGLTKDRANNAAQDAYNVASTASTGYALAVLPIAVTHQWIDGKSAYSRALTTVRFIHDSLPSVHGWYYHFVDMHTGERVWKCELSSIDTTLLIEGALMAGQFWRGTEVQKLADELNERLDWTWMRTNAGDKPRKMVVCMGWRPEDGFISSDWDHYCELMQLYLLGMSSRRDPLPAESWTAWQRNVINYGDMETLAGGPIFMHEMSHIYFDFKNRRDRLGWDYWVSSLNAVKINRQYCLDKSVGRKSYGPNIWGLNADDAPDGYRAFGAPGEEDGTVSPTGAIAAILFTPREARSAGSAMYELLKDKCWSRYGFGDAFNLDRDWYDKDVIGIDLGMVLLAIEDERTGLPWKLISSHPGLQRAWKLASFHPTRERAPRALHTPPLLGRRVSRAPINNRSYTVFRGTHSGGPYSCWQLASPQPRMRMRMVRARRTQGTITLSTAPTLLAKALILIRLRNESACPRKNHTICDTPPYCRRLTFPASSCYNTH